MNHLAFAIIVFPAYWAAAFFYAMLEENIKRASVVMMSVFAVSSMLVVWPLLTH